MLSILNETKTKVFQQEQPQKKSATKFVAYWKANRK